MMRKFTAWTLIVLFVAVIAGGLYLWWRLDLRWRPHVIGKNQAEIGKILEGAGWVSPGQTGPKLYLIAYRDCADCSRYEAAEFPVLQKAGVDTRVILVARADQNGQPKSTAVERSTVAELWVNRNWSLYQRWMASPAGAWTGAGIPAADGDVARSAVIGAGRDMAERLRPLLKANGVSFGYPMLIWWTKDGRMEGCACRAPRSWRYVRNDLAPG
ncbi:MAG: hypothetical protein P4L73_14330 [Caulobacteraceae bacterium]|nr:hypothetical protein [Caulobacteraceae bacterium]